MQSTALALMSVENVLAGYPVHPEVPIYDAIVFCDMNCEPSWVYPQVEFIAAACAEVGIPFYVLETYLMEDQAYRVQNGKYIRMPLWTLQDGKKGKLRRACTVMYKIEAIQMFTKRKLLHFKYRQRMKPHHIGSVEMHLGFSLEESHRMMESQNVMFVNKFPLIEMGWERKDTYKYSLERWQFETKASACYICPFHKNYFFGYLKENYPADYECVLDFDRVLSEKGDDGLVTSELFISYSLKRIEDLTAEDCDDAQTFLYSGAPVWNGF